MGAGVQRDRYLPCERPRRKEHREDVFIEKRKRGKGTRHSSETSSDKGISSIEMFLRSFLLYFALDLRTPCSAVCLSVVFFQKRWWT